MLVTYEAEPVHGPGANLEGTNCFAAPPRLLIQRTGNQVTHSQRHLLFSSSRVTQPLQNRSRSSLRTVIWKLSIRSQGIGRAGSYTTMAYHVSFGSRMLSHITACQRSCLTCTSLCPISRPLQTCSSKTDGTSFRKGKARLHEQTLTIPSNV